MIVLGNVNAYSARAKPEPSHLLFPNLLLPGTELNDPRFEMAETARTINQAIAPCHTPVYPVASPAFDAQFYADVVRALRLLQVKIDLRPRYLGADAVESRPGHTPTDAPMTEHATWVKEVIELMTPSTDRSGSNTPPIVKLRSMSSEPESLSPQITPISSHSPSPSVITHNSFELGWEKRVERASSPVKRRKLYPSRPPIGIVNCSGSIGNMQGRSSSSELGANHNLATSAQLHSTKRKGREDGSHKPKKARVQLAQTESQDSHQSFARGDKMLFTSFRRSSGVQLYDIAPSLQKQPGRQLDTAIVRRLECTAFGGHALRWTEQRRRRRASLRGGQVCTANVCLCGLT